MNDNLEFYIPHSGTVRISGKTHAHRAASCAIRFLGNAFVPVDFLCIGGNANQQACKAMHTFSQKVPQQFPGMGVAFVPLVFNTETVSPLDGVKTIKSCTVWRTILFNGNVVQQGV